MEQEMLYIPENRTEGDDELLKRFDRRRADDAVAMQAALCVIMAGLFFAAHLLFPDIADPVFSRLAGLVRSEHELIGNPIELLEGMF